MPCTRSLRETITYGLSQRILTTMFGLLLTASGHLASAQAIEKLSSPGIVKPDTVHGHVGEWLVLHNLDGETLRLEDLSGRVLFVNFWATWCSPCVEEMPTIIELTDAVAESDVTFLLISIDEEKRDVRRFVKKHKRPFPVYFRGWQPGESTFTAGIVPATFIVSKEGEIVYQHHGAADWNTETIRVFLQELAQRPLTTATSSRK